MSTEARVYLVIFAAGFLGGLASSASRAIERPPDAHFWRHLCVYPGVAAVIATTLTGLAWWGVAGVATPDPIAGPLVASCVGLSGIQVSEVAPILRRVLEGLVRLKSGVTIELQNKQEEDKPRDA